MRGMQGRTRGFLSDASSSACGRAGVCLGFFIVLMVAGGSLPTKGFAERLSVQLSPDAISRALSEHQQFQETRQAIAVWSAVNAQP